MGCAPSKPSSVKNSRGSSAASSEGSGEHEEASVSPTSPDLAAAAAAADTAEASRRHTARERQRLLEEMDALKRPGGSHGNVCREPLVGRAVIATFMAADSQSTTASGMDHGNSSAGSTTRVPAPSMPEGQRKHIQDWRQELDDVAALDPTTDLAAAVVDGSVSPAGGDLFDVVGSNSPSRPLPIRPLSNDDDDSVSAAAEITFFVPPISDQPEGSGE